MAPIAVGDVIPDGALSYLDDQNHPQQLSLHSLAAGKKVILFGVPGAFTPGCSMKHVPGFIEKAEELKSKGADEILCMSVNDPYVMKAWEKTYPENKHVKFLGDGSAKYTQTLGLGLDVSQGGLGIRCWRFALLLDDLKVKVQSQPWGRPDSHVLRFSTATAASVAVFSFSGIPSNGSVTTPSWSELYSELDRIHFWVAMYSGIEIRELGSANVDQQTWVSKRGLANQHCSVHPCSKHETEITKRGSGIPQNLHSIPK
ncbi:peroxiredoxin-2B-like isoform X1 [Camellia sinensis]|uniref:peroxiredoxin-2B-like isoform X1 n=1 Tax=Camellia sinensis TaxID=4442 RepID=UPI001036194E|nr:peroxiredoxin-2B-like isoform X1 [Camellia sinensis]